MFLKIKKITLLLLFIIPLNVYAYSKYVIAGGDSVGIKINTDGVIIVGSYDINGHNNLNDSKLQNGDLILMMNGQKIDSVESMINIINDCNCNEVNITYKRNSKQYNTNLKLYYDENKIKTGLYVKDSITGVGTLTYIDPNTKLFGVLGHEITDNNGNLYEIKSGYITDSKITSITKSDRGIPGEKNAILYSENINGTIDKNTNKGLFGKYTNKLIDNKLYEVATINNIKTGKAKILTVINDNKIEDFDINILSVKDTKNKLKNIEFEVIDKELLNSTNGIVQGMSGSPIIQGEYIIGAVTHVVVNDPHKGYGILITNMLEEGEN